MMVKVINGAGSIFEVKLLIILSHDATLAAENEAAPITHNREVKKNSDSRNRTGMQKYLSNPNF